MELRTQRFQVVEIRRWHGREPFESNGLSSPRGEGGVNRDFNRPKAPSPPGAGYDIASFVLGGRVRWTEEKTTNGWERAPFHISRNELAVAEEQRANWCLMRLWNFTRAPKAFELYPPAPGADVSGTRGSAP
ncbi:DUF3883 domain-containing protein [Stappia taiwanensis]|uniref:DUF3883 domain-containing protein n=1 Tax=Stappia taiwanensis TaxID=992267 RepID=A0A838Y4J1_9HYPH|nr:DUF3883 domain-containing protein [Stappia taiwanensis]MBA4613873.1 DUF3883 domain-containing protein [Stappia taiwanensis]